MTNLPLYHCQQAQPMALNAVLVRFFLVSQFILGFNCDTPS
ncbi:hypothetical protein NIES2134_101480 [Thermostichus vulcanus NIES-2134]|nr:hypothetical protein NIES2134_101480 [Thermostichus vulcanus NIES-2134]